MNDNKKVVVFTLVTTLLLLFYSIFSSFSNTSFLGLRNISIVSDVLKSGPVASPSAPAGPAPLDSIVDAAVASSPSPMDTTHRAYAPGERVMELYTTPNMLMSFAADTTKPALAGFMHKLAEVQKNKKGKVRIAWLGDSMIEGDLLTQTFRKRIQSLLGSYGAGFVAANSVTSGFRTTVQHKWTGDWDEENFRTKTLKAPIFLSGHAFYTGNGTVNLKDATVKDSTQVLEKSLLCGQAKDNITVLVNGQAKQYKADKPINRLLLDNSASRTIQVGIQNKSLPVYGISMEPETGVVVDNFSFRGITGLELSKLDSTFLRTLETENGYDLVILEYGANLMFRPDDTDYSYFQKHIIPVVRKVMAAMPHTDFLLISTADRAFKYEDGWKSAKGINNVIKMQATTAFVNGAAFYNLYNSMGGYGTIVRWADSTTTLANKDYIHPNLRGAEILGNNLYDAFMRDLQKIKVN